MEDPLDQRAGLGGDLGATVDDLGNGRSGHAGQLSDVGDGADPPRWVLAFCAALACHGREFIDKPA